MSSDLIETDYELRIRADRSWLRFDWRGVWEYRDLLILLIRRDFVSKYKQTVLGPAWFIIQPLFTTIVFTLIFGKAAKIPTGTVPPMLFYMCGTLAWSYFSNTFGSTSSTLVSNAGLFGKVYFPRLVVPISAVFSNIFAFAIQFATFIAFWLFFKYATAAGPRIHFQWQIVAMPLMVIQVGILSLGVGLWTSALTAKYRDFMYLSGFIVQLWMYATPIIYPLTVIPPAWRWVVLLNPMTMPTEAFKYIFLGEGYCSTEWYCVSVLLSAFVLITGQMIFQRVERSFVDSV